MSEKLPMEQTAEHFRLTAEQVFSIDPYLDGVAVVFSWKTGNTDLPFGIMIGRDGHIQTPNTLIQLSQQTGKMLMHQADRISNMLEAADQLAGDIAKRIKEMKEQTDGDVAQ
jgi:hypothetical protein